LFGGFAFSDTPANGIGVVVTARDAAQPARALAREIAERGWAERHRFTRALTSEREAISLALERNRPPVIFSDAGDNPGGGGSGRTSAFLQSLIAAGAETLLYGSFLDPELASDAHKAGPVGRFVARFNRSPATAWDHPFESQAEVIGLSDGDVIGRLGIFRNRRLALGPSAALRIGGVTLDGDLGAQPDRRPDALRDGRSRYRSRPDRGREVARPLPRRLRALVPAGAGLRGRHRGRHLAGARPVRLAPPAAAGLSA